MTRPLPSLATLRDIEKVVLAGLQTGATCSGEDVLALLQRRGYRADVMTTRQAVEMIRIVVADLRAKKHEIETIRGWRCDAVADDYVIGSDAILDLFAANVGVILGVADLQDVAGSGTDPTRIAGRIDNHIYRRIGIEIRPVTRWRLVPKAAETVRVVSGLVLSGNASDLDVVEAYALVDRGGVVDHAGPVVVAAVERGIVQEDLGRDWFEASVMQGTR